jgi:hypothetical protein
MEYALHLQPSITSAQHKALFDALQLRALCNHSAYAAGAFAAAARRPRRATPAATAATTAAACQFFVDAQGGSDASGDGSLSKPFATLPKAVSATRATAAGSSACSIELRAGTHRLSETLVLTEQDSGLTIEGYNGEAAVLSGARLLDGLSWVPRGSKGAYAADVAALKLGSSITSLRLGGKRVTRARYPNANAETDLFPAGYIQASDPGDGSEWRKPTYPPYHQKDSRVCDPHMQCGVSENVTTPVDASTEWHGMYQNYSIGVGGACAVYADGKSPWCSGDFYLLRQFPEMHTRHPAGLNMSIQSWFPGLVNTPYLNSTGAIVHAWRTGHWYTWMFEIGAEVHSDQGDFFMFTAGGNQGGEGDDRAGEWWIENVIEELDVPNEYFHDEVAQELHIIYNGTGAPPAELELEVPQLATLIEVRGASPQAPAVGIMFKALTITANRPTFMDQRANPSGGDWALERTGALLFENTENASITGNLFQRLDSNAISINGYNQHTEIAENEAVWLGQNFVAAWGRADGNDGTNGLFPRYTSIVRNFVHEIGHIQKQSSFFFQAETAQTHLEANIVFNIPRAAINFKFVAALAPCVSSRCVAHPPPPPRPPPHPRTHPHPPT